MSAWEHRKERREIQSLIQLNKIETTLYLLITIEDFSPALFEYDRPAVSAHIWFCID